VRQTQRVEPPVNLHCYWNSTSMSLYWIGLCYCVIWLWREIWRNVKVTFLVEVTP